MRRIDEIIIHCSATEAGKDFRCADIDKWHRERGFDGVGYHFVVDLDGTIEEGRLLQRVGAHCKGRNVHSIGVCYIGGLLHGKPADTRTEAQKEALCEIIDGLRHTFGEELEVHGHREYANKDCPCFDAYKEYNV